MDSWLTAAISEQWREQFLNHFIMTLECIFFWLTVTWKEEKNSFGEAEGLQFYIQILVQFIYGPCGIEEITSISPE